MGIITEITVQHQIARQPEPQHQIVHRPEVLRQTGHQPVSRKDLLLWHVLQPQTVSQEEHHLPPGRQLQIIHPDPDRVLHQSPDQALHLHPDRVTHQVPDQ